MALFSFGRMIYYGKTLFPIVQPLVEKAMNNYVESIEPDEWTQKVAGVDIESMSYADMQKSKELAQQFAGLVDGQCDNLHEAIQNDPVRWGAFLDSRGIDEKKISELQQTIAEGGDVPPLELIKLTIGSGTSNEKTDAEPAPQPLEDVKEEDLNFDADQKSDGEPAKTGASDAVMSSLVENGWDNFGSEGEGIQNQALQL